MSDSESESLPREQVVDQTRNYVTTTLLVDVSLVTRLFMLAHLYSYRNPRRSSYKSLTDRSPVLGSLVVIQNKRTVKICRLTAM